MVSANAPFRRQTIIPPSVEAGNRCPMLCPTKLGTFYGPAVLALSGERRRRRLQSKSCSLNDPFNQHRISPHSLKDAPFQFGTFAERDRSSPASIRFLPNSADRVKQSGEPPSQDLPPCNHLG
jgi:hypothetical protein